MTGLNFPNAVNDENDFYGRRDGLRLIENTFLQNRRVPVLVIGERRTGKTSLMNVAVRRLQAAACHEETGNTATEGPGGLRFISLPVEPRGITTFNAFARSILLRMAAHFGGGLPDSGMGAGLVIPEIEAIEQFEGQIAELLHCGSPTDHQETFLVCIDEFDEIVRQTHGQELSRILGLIYNLVERAELPIGFFFTMTSVPDAMKEEVPSTLIAMAQVLELRPFEPADTTKLVTDVSAGRLEWPDERLRQLIWICGGHPYFTKLILSHLLQLTEGSEPAPVTQEMLDQAVREALDDPRTDHVFENLYHVHFSEAEKEVLLLLARRQNPLPGKELAQVGAAWVTAARRLVKRHYLAEEEGNFRFKAAFMGEWLRGWISYEEECAKYLTLQKRLAVPKEIEVDVAAGQVLVLGVPVKLSAQEFAIMDFLAERSGQLVRREELVDRVWGTNQGVSDQMIDTAFYRLRRKIGDQGQYIETILGQGFKLHRAVRIAGPGRKGQAGQEGDAL